MNLRAQNLEKHLWNDRVLLIITPSLENGNSKKQLAELNDNVKALKERKLVVYQITPKAYRTILPKSSGWMENKEFAKRFFVVKNPLKVILIGLDGGIKLEQNTFLSNNKLFNTIDAMPIRRSELKNE